MSDELPSLQTHDGDICLEGVVLATDAPETVVTGAGRDADTHVSDLHRRRLVANDQRQAQTSRLRSNQLLLRKASLDDDALYDRLPIPNLDPYSYTHTFTLQSEKWHSATERRFRHNMILKTLW